MVSSHDGLPHWYVYQHDGDPLGPWSTNTIATEILAGKLAPDVWVAAPGGPRWLRARDVPVISRLVDVVPSVPRRRESGLRLMPSYVRESVLGSFGSTMTMGRDDELEYRGPASGLVSSNRSRPAPIPRVASPADQTAKMYGFAPVEDAPPTDRELAALAAPLPNAGVTSLTKQPRVVGDMAVTDRRRRRKNA